MNISTVIKFLILLQTKHDIVSNIATIVAELIQFIYDDCGTSRSHIITKVAVCNPSRIPFLYHVCDPSRIPYSHKNNRRKHGRNLFSAATSFRTATMVAIFFQLRPRSEQRPWSQSFFSTATKVAILFRMPYGTEFL